MYLGAGKRRISWIEGLGKIIKLDDFSRWEVKLGSPSSAMGWSTGDEVEVRSAGLDYDMKNLKRNETAHVKHLGK
jgi:hypothetical protein